MWQKASEARAPTPVRGLLQGPAVIPLRASPNSRAKLAWLASAAGLALMVLASPRAPWAESPSRSIAASDRSSLDVALEMLAPPPGLRRIAVEAHPSHGSPTRRWTAHLALGSAGGARRLALTLLDGEGAGLTLIARQRHDGVGVWILDPKSGRVATERRIAPGRVVSQLGVTLEDLGLLDTERRAFEPLEDASVDGVPARAVVERFGGRSGGIHAVDWIAVEDATLLRREEHRGDGTLLRTSHYEAVGSVDGIAVPFFVRHESASGEADVDLEVRDVRHDLRVPKDLFDPARIRQVATHRVWRKLSTPYPPETR